MACVFDDVDEVISDPHYDATMPDFESFFGCKPSASHTFKPVVPEHPLAEGTTWTLQTVDGDLRVTVSANDPEQLEELRQRAVTLGWEII